MSQSPQAQVTVTIDGVPVTVPAGTLLVEAAKLVARDIPVYCYHPKLGPAGLCRICLVDIEKMPKLQIACNTVVADGMVVHTANDKANEGRRAVLEFLLANHPLDCPICDKGGECDLQDYAMAYGQSASRLVEAKTKKPKAIDLGPTIVLDDERCIVCQRCSRFDEIVTGERSLVVKERGQRDVIATASGDPYVSDFSGNVTELCPVGALTSKTYRFKSRPWDLRRTLSTCTQCSVGCGANLDVRHGEILRVMADPDDLVSDGWLCDRGRYNVGYVGDDRRITAPLLRSGDGWEQIGWDDAIAAWASALRAAGAARSAVLGGGRLLNEEALLLAKAMRAFGIRDLDWRTGRQIEAVPGRLRGSPADLEAAQTIVVLGVPPSQTAPVLDLRIRKAVAQRGARLFVVGPHASGSFVPATRVDDVAGIPDAALAVARVAVVYDGIGTAAFASTVARLAPFQAAGTSVSGFIPGEQPNARGAETMGLVPRDGGRDTRAILESARAGEIGALAMIAANPVLHFPDRALVEAALAATPFVVTTELFLTETALRSHLVLPARGAFEKSGTTTDLTGAVRQVRAAIEAPEGTLGDGDAIVALAAELGIDLPAPHDIAAEAAALIAAPAAASAAPHAEVPAPATPGDGEAIVVVTRHSASGGGTSRFDERFAPIRPVPRLTLSRTTARRLGVEDGDVARAESASGAALEAAIRIDGELAEGYLAIVDGASDAPANAFAESEPVRVSVVRRAPNAVGANA